VYFHNIPLRITATPKIGYKFVQWEEGGINPDTVFTLTKEAQLVAQFEPDAISIIPPIIDETYTLYKLKSPYYTKGDIIINLDASLQIEPGVEINMANNSSFYIYGNIRALGTENEEIIIKPNYTSGAENWGNLCFENTSSLTMLEYLVLENATNPYKNTKHFSTISAYNSQLLINHITIDSKAQPFYSEYGEIEIHNSFFHSDISSDLINIKYAHTAVVENCTLLGNESVDADAIDYDDLNGGIIRGNYIAGFIGYNSDGIDLGEEAKNILIENNTIFSCADKGISIGQSSTAVVKNNIIAYCNQGLGIKDEGSYALIDKNTFYGNYYAVACFEKNFREGGGNATITNSIIALSQQDPVFVDSLSTLTVSYTLCDSELLEGEKNIKNIPYFKDETIFNFELAENSPCINAGDPNSTYDLDGTITDMGALSTYSNMEYGKVIINEINYHSDSLNDSDDWVELYNASNHVINLSGYSFLDEKNDHMFTLPDGILLNEKEYFVLCKNDSSFKTEYPYIPNYLGNFEFGLSNNSERIRLFDAQMNLINSVTYSDASPWPYEPDGKGYTLELISEELDNSIPINWRKSPFRLGSPGKSNNPTILASFDHEIYSDCSGLVYFINTSEEPYDSIRWDFGDGTTATANAVEHVYNSAGTYSAALTIYSYFGTSTVKTDLLFQNTMTQPIVKGDTVCSEGYLTLTAEGSHKLFWFTDRFGGEAIFEGNTYETEFLKSTQTFYVSNNFGSCESNRIAVEAKVYKSPLSYFIYEINNGLLTTKNVSLNGTEYLWNFGDGTTSSEFEPTHQYTENGTYTIKLTVNNLFCDQTHFSYSTINVLNVNIHDYLFNTWLSVYPNPSSGLININFKQELLTTAEIKIYNLYGQLITTKTVNTTHNSKLSFDLSARPKGIYIISVGMNDQHILKKVIIQ
jgi:parallel beta-helix repeat protein